MVTPQLFLLAMPVLPSFLVSILTVTVLSSVPPTSALKLSLSGICSPKFLFACLHTLFWAPNLISLISRPLLFEELSVETAERLRPLFLQCEQRATVSLRVQEQKNYPLSRFVCCTPACQNPSSAHWLRKKLESAYGKWLWPASTLPSLHTPQPPHSPASQSGSFWSPLRCLLVLSLFQKQEVFYHPYSLFVAFLRHLINREIMPGGITSCLIHPSFN